jgi:penicillin-binding protein 1A
MQVALADTPESPLVIPPGITQVRIDRTTGNLTQRSDHTSLFEYFAEGTEPTIMVRTDQVVDPLVTDGTKPKEQGDEIF